MNKIAIISLLLLSACAINKPYAYSKRSAEIDSDLIQKEYACVQSQTCGGYALPYYLK